MAIAEHTSGTASLTVAGGETVLNGTSPETTDGIYQLLFDRNAMVRGDILIARIKEKTISGGTERIVWERRWAHAPGAEKIVASPAIMLLHGWDMSLETDVNSVSIPWSIRKVT